MLVIFDAPVLAHRGRKPVPFCTSTGSSGIRCWFFPDIRWTRPPTTWTRPNPGFAPPVRSGGSGHSGGFRCRPGPSPRFQPRQVSAPQFGIQHQCTSRTRSDGCPEGQRSQRRVHDRLGDGFTGQPMRRSTPPAPQVQQRQQVRDRVISLDFSATAAAPTPARPAGERADQRHGRFARPTPARIASTQTCSSPTRQGRRGPGSEGRPEGHGSIRPARYGVSMKP